EELVGLARAVQAGHYQSRAPVRARDEVGELAAAFNEMTEALAQKEMARQQLLRRVIDAGEEERRRIARELHDHTGQALTSQIAALSALENRMEDAAVRARLGELRRHTERMLEEVHNLSVALRPSVLDDVGLTAAVRRHCRVFAERAGIEVDCAEMGLEEQRLPGEAELTLYRVVQEALTNAVRHGRATRVRVMLLGTDTGVLACVQDNGCGFDARQWQRRCLAENRLGLLGIEERVTLLGGTFCVESQPGQGTCVLAEVPRPLSP
ncbi:MAG: histidine kinase, partial [Verrucomicrobiales bacterium]|nr:histidine kinase [Verrucomicrobiales bacterium]